MVGVEVVVIFISQIFRGQVCCREVRIICGGS